MDYGDSKPKVYVNGKSAAKLRIGERSTTMGQRPVGFSESEKGDILTSKVEDGKNPRVQSTKIIVKIYAELYRNIQK